MNPTVAAKRKHNTFLSTFILSFNDFCMTLESKCNFPHFFKNAFDLYKLFWKSGWLEFLCPNTFIEHIF